MSLSLQQIIESNVHLQPSTQNGWRNCLHTNCDHGRKGNRAAFLFDVDGSIAFNCFNCSTKVVYKVGEKISHKFITVLHDFGITEQQYKHIFLENLIAQKTESSKKITSVELTEPKQITLPSYFYPLKGNETDKLAQKAIDYLIKRSIEPSSYEFLLCKVNNTGLPSIDKWGDRIIFPIYKDGKLIFYQGRSLGNSMQKYESANTEKERVLYGFDRLFEHTESPLFIVEGFFDALVIDGVAIFGNTISTQQTMWLNRSRRKKVYIPDKLGSGHLAAQQALDNGWSISIPDYESKDVNAAVTKYGKLYVMSTIMDNICDGVVAKTKLGVWCEPSSGSNKSTKPFRKKGRHLRSRSL